MAAMAQRRWSEHPDRERYHRRMPYETREKTVELRVFTNPREIDSTGLGTILVNLTQR